MSNWNEQQVEVLKKMYPDHYAKDISKVIGKSESSIYNQAFKYGIKKSEEFKNSELQKQGERLQKQGSAYRFKGGIVPHNKGQKMPTAVYEKVKRTMFKKGMMPINAKYDGHERISKDGYIEIRIKAGKYILKHRHIWEQRNGPIPKNMIVVFKDKNPQNIVIENLELISREENMKRNTIHRYPTELKSVIRLVNKLNKKIHEKQN